MKNRVRIAQKLLRLCERPDIPVVAGSPKPLGGGPFPLNPQYLLSWKEGGHEGRGILDEYDQPSVSIPSIHGSIFMIEALRYAERPVSVACIGPVTNLALAITIAPDIKEKIENVLIMGGCLNPGRCRSRLWAA